jgi:hypothetical protein
MGSLVLLVPSLPGMIPWKFSFKNLLIFYKKVKQSRKLLFWEPQAIVAGTAGNSRSDRLYSPGNWGVKKYPAPQGTGSSVLLLPSLNLREY